MGHWFHEKGLSLAGVVVGSGLWLEPARTEVARRVKYYKRIRHGECERVGHDAEFGRETPGRLSVDLNQHGGGIEGDTL